MYLSYWSGFSIATSYDFLFMISWIKLRQKQFLREILFDPYQGKFEVLEVLKFFSPTFAGNEVKGKMFDILFSCEKVSSACQIAGYVNWQYLQKMGMKCFNY